MKCLKLLVSESPPLSASPRKTSLFPESCFSGAGEGNRTPDPLITNQMLYRLSYASGGSKSLRAQYFPDPFRKVLGQLFKLSQGQFTCNRNEDENVP